MMAEGPTAGGFVDWIVWPADKAIEMAREANAVEAALFVLGALLALRGLYWIWRLARGKPGPVEINELTDSQGDKPNARMTQLVRARVADSGLLSLPVPIAATAGPTAVVEEAPLPQAKWIAALVEHVPGFVRPKYGHRVTGTTWSKDGQTCLALQIVDAASDHPPQALVLAGADEEDVARKAAAAIHGAITSPRRVARRIKPWKRWRGPSAPGLALLQRAKALERTSSRPAIRAAYDDAVEADPLNGLLRVHRAALLETGVARWGLGSQTFEHLLDAVEDYREVSGLWPRFWEARYRLAAVYSFTAWWHALWRRLEGPDERAAAQGRFARVTGEVFTGDGPSPEMLLTLASKEWDELAHVQSGRPWKMRRVIELGSLCTRLQLTSLNQRDDRNEARALVAQSSRLGDATSVRRPWQLEYNFACFYSIAMSALESERHAFAARALRHLDQAAETAGAELDRKWMLADPDLEALDEWLEHPSNFDGAPASVWFWRGFFLTKSL